MDLTKAQVDHYRYHALSGDFSEFGSKVQEAYRKLEIKHANYMTEKEKKEFVQNLINFLKLEDIDFVTKIVSVRQFCQFPLETYEVIHYNMLH